MKQVSVVSRPRTDHVRSSETIDDGLCELGGGGGGGGDALIRRI